MTRSQRLWRLALVLVVGLLVLAACTAGVNPEVGNPDPDGRTAGFLMGIWHGAIAPITFFISLFSDNINIYDVNNNGNWYDFGFVIGAGLLFGGGIFGKRR